MDAMTPAAMMAAIPQDPPKPTTHDVTILTTRKSAKAKVLGVPPEEVGVERGARDIQSCNYFFHDIVTNTEGDLIADGYDEDMVRSLETYNGHVGTETTARDSVNEHGGGPSDLNTATRPVAITEHYVRMDYEGKGKPCLYMVITGIGQGDILKKDGKDCVYPIDVIPFATTTPIPIPHRFFGRSLADVVMPIQREKTALKRSALDNLYLHNNPRVEVAETHAGPNTLDDLLVSRSGGVVRSKMPGGIAWQVVPDITPSIYPMMQYLDAQLESGTGVSKQTQGIDADALQNQSATAVAQVFSASQMRMKLIARNFAEGMRDIFSLLHHTIRSHGQEKQTVRLRNEWIPVDPRQWKTRSDMTINVGLGSGGKAQQYAQMMGLANFQKELLLGGKVNLVDDQALFNSASELSKIMGHKNPDKFFNDPSAKDPQTGQPLHPPVPPPPDPKVMQIQMQAQLDEKADQRKAQIETVQAQADIATSDRKMQAEMAMQEREFDLKAKLAMMEADLERQKFAAEEERKEREHQQKMALEMQKHQLTMESTAITHHTKIEEMKAKPKAAKASIDIKHGGDEVAALDKKIDAHSEAMLAAVKELSRPKRIVRDPKTGKASHTESI